MKTKNIFKALALAMLMPAMMLTTSCSSDDDAINNNDEPVKKGYALPVTINVTRQSDKATTRAEYNESTKKLSFSTGDQLFVKGYESSAGSFAGTLTWQSGETFSGTITTEKAYTGTADALFTAADLVDATLLPANYGDYHYLSITENDGYNAYPDLASAKAFATSKATAIEQFSYEVGDYVSGTGFDLSPWNAILNFTITGLTANAPVTASLADIWGDDIIGGQVTTDSKGNATFAMGLKSGWNLNELSLTVGGNAITLTSGSKDLEAGHVYNFLKSVVSPSLVEAFVTGNTTEIAFTSSYGTLTLSATYSGGSFGDVTKSGTLQTFVSAPSMARNGNNLEITITVSIPGQGAKTGTMTIDTVNKTYSWSNPAVGALITLNSITIGGNSITPLPTVTP